MKQEKMSQSIRAGFHLFFFPPLEANLFGEYTGADSLIALCAGGPRGLLLKIVVVDYGGYNSRLGTKAPMTHDILKQPLRGRCNICYVSCPNIMMNIS